jgi:hypothetical protein
MWIEPELPRCILIRQLPACRKGRKQTAMDNLYGSPNLEGLKSRSRAREPGTVHIRDGTPVRIRDDTEINSRDGTQENCRRKDSPTPGRLPATRDGTDAVNTGKIPGRAGKISGKIEPNSGKACQPPGRTHKNTWKGGRQVWKDGSGDWNGISFYRNDLLPGKNGVLPGRNDKSMRRNDKTAGQNGVLRGRNDKLADQNGVLPGRKDKSWSRNDKSMFRNAISPGRKDVWLGCQLVPNLKGLKSCGTALHIPVCPSGRRDGADIAVGFTEWMAMPSQRNKDAHAKTGLQPHEEDMRLKPNLPRCILTRQLKQTAIYEAFHPPGKGLELYIPVCRTGRRNGTGPGRRKPEVNQPVLPPEWERYVRKETRIVSWSGLLNADRSGDAVRFEGVSNSADLSACAAPDNVKGEKKDTNRMAQLNADRSGDAVRFNDADPEKNGTGGFEDVSSSADLFIPLGSASAGWRTDNVKQKK